MTDKLTVTVLGTGIMGAAMARNLARAGHTVRAWNRTRAKAEPLTADGVTVVDSAAEAVRGADAVVTMLYDGGAVRDVMRDALPGLGDGTLWVQSTTAALDSVEEFAEFAREHGLVFFDAPVLGTRQPAEAGQLTVLAAGAVSQRAAVAPVFDAVGARTVWTGEEPGGATRLKLVANSWVLAATAATGEVLALAQSLDVDPQDFFALIAGGPLDMGYLHAKAALILEDRLSPAQFGVTTAEKDARLIVEAGRAGGVRLDVAEAAAERLARAAAAGHGEEDMAAAYFASFGPDASGTGSGEQQNG
ncbi:NAD(P)-dependent oxidoreductase [Streptomyces acidiscabies]|uniref:NAD(P)-dependent oxidoreductase n=1 Tax=Streptomyces acidiscabies TaxID=42234 RepID=A0AAP6BAN3_9ACTN|nr:NAD(P)-dependent oxidoreductase [Streptomyces acidiscabies]MBP5935167.1 NAD(P)-dependent oxidoreductase [Streptomyces sp. LBUM 1476]MBZ3917019.1 NAD(P)-dependent oxidoreductase [Streptomyces acidiscabies]MDX2961258.1 NAD(P)-dependent oxidoreductase [Streptomyces acidiscabies]MDX3022616.1 NAD(P)-dependent oxidoreductase [Streptomyces acidiscabies]MDX3791980.1 NAD(P)-dependent oxidoreductase [Streptomyces acidiscabies]